MSERTPQTPVDFDVDLAFDYEKRHQLRDRDAYLATRPKMDDNDGVHDPNMGGFVKPDEFFDQRREAIADEEAEKTKADYAYEEMSVPQLARKLAAAEFVQDQTIAETIDDELSKRLDSMDEKFYSQRDSGGTRSTRPENNAKNNNEVRSENLENRVMKIKDRELARLKAENIERGDWDGDLTGREVESDEADREAGVAADEHEDNRASEAEEPGNDEHDAAAEAETEVIDAEVVEDERAPEGDEPESDEADEIEAEASETAPEIEQEQPGEQFKKTLEDWNDRLKDPRYTPTVQEYEAMAELAGQIELRHKDPETDGQSGMGYFIARTDIQLSSYYARTLLDTVKTGEWILSQGNYDDALKVAAASEDDRLPARTLAGKRSHKNDLMPLNEFSEERDFQSYKRYVQNRLDLDKYLMDTYGIEDRARKLASESIGKAEGQPKEQAQEQIEEETDKKSRHSLRNIAARGLRNAARKALEKRRGQAEEQGPAEEEPTEEKSSE